jgi:hypothetical protein
MIAISNLRTNLNLVRQRLATALYQLHKSDGGMKKVFDTLFDPLPDSLEYANYNSLVVKKEIGEP